MAKSHYTALISEKAKFCAGKTTKMKVKQVAAKYVSNAMKRGKTKSEAETIAGRVLRKGCSVSSSIAGKRKRSRKGKTVKVKHVLAGKRRRS